MKTQRDLRYHDSEQKQYNNHSLTNTKRSTAMNTKQFLRKGLMAIISVLMITSMMFGGDFKNTGTLKNKTTKTITVSANNFVNSGTVQNAGTIGVTAGSFVNSSNVDNFIAASTAGKIIVGDSYRQTAGTTINYSGSLVGDVQVTDSLSAGGTFTTDAGKVSFIGAAQVVPALTYGTIAALGSGTKTLAGAATVNDSIRINSTLATGANTLTINAGTGYVLTDATGTLDGTGGTVDYAKDANQTIFPSTLYNNLSLTGTTGKHDKSSNGAVTVAGTLLINASDSLDISSGVLTISGGSSVLNNSGGIKLNASGNVLTPNSITAAGSFVYYAATTQAIAAFNYDDLILRNATTGNEKTLAAVTIGIAKNLTLENMVGTDVQFNSGSTVNYNGSITQNVAALSYGILSFSSTGDKVITGAVTSVSTTVGSGVVTTDGLWINGGSLTTSSLTNDGLITNDGSITVN